MTYLLDVNCLVALAWPNHVHCESVRRWFALMADEGWATIPATQTGFLRVSMNKKVTGTEIGLVAALTVLKQLLQKGSHTPVECAPVPGAWPRWLARRIQGYRQITDAALIATAHRSGCAVATIDAGLRDLVDRDHTALVHLVPV